MVTLEEHIADNKAHSKLTNRTTAITEADLNFGNIMMRGIKVGTADAPESLPAGSIYLKVSSLTSITLITFTIAGTSYQAEEGMTWEQWVNSSYNTDGFICLTDLYCVQSPDNKYVHTSTAGKAEPHHIIYSENAYVLSSQLTGGGGTVD